jgi:hypothetical protein
VADRGALSHCQLVNKLADVEGIVSGKRFYKGEVHFNF